MPMPAITVLRFHCLGSEYQPPNGVHTFGCLLYTPMAARAARMAPPVRSPTLNPRAGPHARAAERSACAARHATRARGRPPPSGRDRSKERREGRALPRSDQARCGTGAVHCPLPLHRRPARGPPLFPSSSMGKIRRFFCRTSSRFDSDLHFSTTERARSQCAWDAWSSIGLCGARATEMSCRGFPFPGNSLGQPHAGGLARACALCGRCRHLRERENGGSARPEAATRRAPRAAPRAAPRPRCRRSRRASTPRMRGSARSAPSSRPAARGTYRYEARAPSSPSTPPPRVVLAPVGRLPARHRAPSLRMPLVARTRACVGTRAHACTRIRTRTGAHARSLTYPFAAWLRNSGDRGLLRVVRPVQGRGERSQEDLLRPLRVKG